MATPRRQPGFAEVMRQGWKPASQRSSANHAAPPREAVPPELVKRREELSGRFAELQWDLGGMAYEMASRDHFRLDVLNKQAARLQEIDAELGQIEHVLKLDQAGATGACPSCGALHARGAVFCWQCGNELKQPTEGATTARSK
jgi:hypothetical protein